MLGFSASLKTVPTEIEMFEDSLEDIMYPLYTFRKNVKNFFEISLGSSCFLSQLLFMKIQVSWCILVCIFNRINLKRLIYWFQSFDTTSNDPSLRRHGSSVSLQSNTLSTASGSSLKRANRSLREKFNELETFKDILFGQIETLQR